MLGKTFDNTVKQSYYYSTPLYRLSIASLPPLYRLSIASLPPLYRLSTPSLSPLYCRIKLFCKLIIFAIKPFANILQQCHILHT